MGESGREEEGTWEDGDDFWDINRFSDTLAGEQLSGVVATEDGARDEGVTSGVVASDRSNTELSAELDRSPSSASASAVSSLSLCNASSLAAFARANASAYASSSSACSRDDVCSVGCREWCKVEWADP